MSPNDYDVASRAEVSKLFERYSEGLLAYIRGALPIAKSDAMDVLQITFIELLKWHDNNPGRTIDARKTFVYRVATRHLRKYVEKCGRTASSPHSAVGFEDLEISSKAREDDVEYMGGLSIERKILLRAMRRLEGSSESEPAFSEPQRILYLKFWTGMTDRQIGEVFEISRVAVVHRVRAAIDALRKTMAGLEEEEPGSTQTSTTILDLWLKHLRATAR